jgi:hypothetical protein
LVDKAKIILYSEYMAEKKIQLNHKGRCPTCGHYIGLAERNAAIVREREQGVTLEAIGKRYGVTRTRIHAICKDPAKWKGLAK